MKYAIKQAFTLVELIVVITILAILATIGYISILGYAITARDSIRISNIANIGKVLELYNLQEGSYPPVTNPINVTFSGATIWQQGSFGEDTRRFTQRISEVPIDPLTFDEFAYSKTIATGEYQVGTIVEKDSSISYTPSLFVGESYAAVNPLASFATTMIKGNYNGKFIAHKEGVNLYILGVPSILANIITSTTLQQIHVDNAFVYKGGPAAPATYSGSVQPQGLWNFIPTNVTGQEYLIYSGSVSDMNTGSGKLDFIGNLKDYYASTDVGTSRDYIGLENIDTTNKPNTAIDFVNTYILSGVGGLGDDYLTVTEVDTSGEEGGGSTGVSCLFDTGNFDQCDFS